MSTTRAPRWATVTYIAAALFVVCAVFVQAHRLGLDFEETLGYVWTNFGNIFVLLVVLGLLLNATVAGVSFLKLRRWRGKLNGWRITPGEWKRLIAMLALSAVASITPAWLIFAQPLGTFKSVAIAIGITAVGFLLMNHISRPLRGNPEIDRMMTEIPDEVLKATDEPSEPARWIP